LLVPLLLGANRDKWVDLADHDLTFARKMTAAEVRFDSKFIYEVIADRIYPNDCKVLESRLAGLSNAEKAEVDWYSEDYCYPWTDRWVRELQRCRGSFAPAWCNKEDPEQDIGRHFEISRYFERLTSELDSERGSLVRYNIMAIMVERLYGWPLFDFHPWKSVCDPVSKAVAAFLKDASPDDALTIGEQLSACFTHADLASPFRDYRDKSPTLTDEHRAYLADLLAWLQSPTRSADALKAWERVHRRYGTDPPQSKSSTLPVANRTNTEDIVLLLARVETHFNLEKERKLTDLWNELAPLSHDMNEQPEFERTEQDRLDLSDILSWKVVSVRVGGDIALVTSEVTRVGRRGSSKGKAFVGHDRELWEFGNGSWFVLMPWPPGFNEMNFVEVALPQKQ
jgi:hypothetical protein